MKTSEFIQIVEDYKKKLLVTNIVWGVVSLLLISLLFFQIKKYDEKNLVVISDNGRFTAQETNDEALYYFDVKNFTKVLMRNIHEYDKSDYGLKLDEAKVLMDAAAFKTVNDALNKVQMKSVLNGSKVKVRIDIDSIKIYENSRPIQVQCFLKQNIISDFELVRVNGIGVNFYLNSTNKSEYNPFGLQATGLGYFNYNFNSTQGLTDEQIEVLKNQIISNQKQNDNGVESQK
jgi:hypothetical protein